MLARSLREPIHQAKTINHKPASAAAKEIVRQALLSGQFGETVSVRATIAAVRELGSELIETDCQLTEIIMFEAINLGRFIAFDLHE
ncbi:hypothetical protein EN836_27820 [Mesorhizobium sp. M1C.F.Ca.ET.193.01.1.1]|uniref:hypothetical protein n=1 Tax=unclassified Mesorhizobium TaxID=325217 RepID=UPI000FD3A74C|nr:MULTISPECIES: hypothetical protein [unclassified Mesorhizobium]TGS93412.1 hypothetical protein EN820_48485 [bacterium M00.F.Ca.ET.177.01.1.1]TGQ50700.1 hypothetical protein EN853_27815 [Mesorhizobium sp. M1C.F.Ca.ET.210.01.1.1]TGQ65866.1 hypothetical protein EN855_027825 [Mesorhizobium sp. M1C.F.Ca.ET.212.01.1.1]TGQ99871.1 hypothetical protein EN847_27815 [Mesorhizobium sp. M1C.F.Ca.ET.204.01.1.1]TGR20404.1 hypothetical protein EN839_27815 [Mesorhizobium sp. M1C.F.Ca.ET.196.01.1.1]